MSGLLLVLTAAQVVAGPPPPPPLPFGVGERFEYGAKWGIFSVGRATVEVASIDTVRETPTFHFRYTLEASIPLYSITSTLESWTTMDALHSLRFRQDNQERTKRFTRQFEIFPDSGYYRQVEPDPMDRQPGVAEPLDDASVLYFIRSLPLEVGKTSRFIRYFRADRNPIVINVLKRETMSLPDGSRVRCLVLNPVVGERGLFGPRADARLWLTDDARRIPVQIRSIYPWGEITLRLQRMVRPS